MRVFVSTVADDTPIHNGTGPVAKGVCSIGFIMYVLLVNVFTAVEELR